MRVSEDERIQSMETGREVEQGHRHLCRFLSPGQELFLLFFPFRLTFSVPSIAVTDPEESCLNESKRGLR